MLLLEAAVAIALGDARAIMKSFTRLRLPHSPSNGADSREKFKMKYKFKQSKAMLETYCR